MLILVGAGAVGAVIGYLTWFAIRPWERPLDLKTLSAFVGIAFGAAITQLFPAGSQTFAAYAIGLALGFGCVPIGTHLRAELRRVRKARGRKDQALDGILSSFFQLSSIRSRAAECLDRDWPGTKKYIRSILGRTGRVTVSDLEPLECTGSEIEILKKYAREHHDTVEFRRDMRVGAALFLLEGAGPLAASEQRHPKGGDDSQSPAP